MNERDAAILGVARELFLADGYYGLTMERIGTQCGVSKGTIYHYFSCKEEIVIALAEVSLRKRTELMRRGAQFSGTARERMLALGEAVCLFTQLNPGDSRIIHSAMGPLREKTPPLRLQSLVHAEQEELGLLRRIIESALGSGDLELKYGTTVDEVLFGTWGLVDGAYALIEGGVHTTSLSLLDPFDSVLWFWNSAADGYGWRPLTSEWDYAESLIRVRKEVFAEEAQKVFGEGKWHGPVQSRRRIAESGL
ncbi:MAG: TetR/AcrR family transcriptional regulator [Candidatus Hydrogenedentes bacterium]|nr:TetR/AcrR family transcriptional regulator [Candidatus Hydrogenedentota bacterium]